jgi:alkylation response protein AidB-like acyl-CoA dehydrogenase
LTLREVADEEVPANNIRGSLSDLCVEQARGQPSGEGAGIGDVVDVCYALGRACASTAMVYAMHQTKVACLVRHGGGSAWHQLLLRRLCNEQLLLASSTTEGQAGGDVRNSAAPVERGDSRIALERQATVISYGEAADGEPFLYRRHQPVMSRVGVDQDHRSSANRAYSM